MVHLLRTHSTISKKIVIIPNTPSNEEIEGVNLSPSRIWMVVNRHSPVWIGVSLSYVSVLPSWPLSFLPQHLTAFPLMTAQVDMFFADIWLAPVRPLTETGVSWLVVLLSLPSLP